MSSVVNSIGLYHFIGDILFHCMNISQLSQAAISGHLGCLKFFGYCKYVLVTINMVHMFICF